MEVIRKNSSTDKLTATRMKHIWSTKVTFHWCRNILHWWYGETARSIWILSNRWKSKSNLPQRIAYIEIKIIWDPLMTIISIYCVIHLYILNQYHKIWLKICNHTWYSSNCFLSASLMYLWFSNPCGFYRFNLPNSSWKKCFLLAQSLIFSIKGITSLNLYWIPLHLALNSSKDLWNCKIYRSTSLIRWVRSSNSLILSTFVDYLLGMLLILSL